MHFDETDIYPEVMLSSQKAYLLANCRVRGVLERGVFLPRLSGRKNNKPFHKTRPVDYFFGRTTSVIQAGKKGLISTNQIDYATFQLDQRGTSTRVLSPKTLTDM
jgi:hypothetical protein